ncbi:Transthyretin-like family protein [Aphelenchoides bicaudatus]|nr:Transthyretin-like family protein [Aphelenchoides bicaudatus]
MNVTKTDQYGTYSISGWNDPSFGRGIHPVINIYHSCGAGSCYQLSIPKEYITKGRNPVVSFNAPDVELSVAKDNSFCVVNLNARTESTAVYGSIYCKTLGYIGGEVDLVDHYKLSNDVIMNSTLSNMGMYSVSGWNDPSLGRGIDPKVKIYFKCGSGISKCYEYSVPKEYITKGKTPATTYDAPDIELVSLILMSLCALNVHARTESTAVQGTLYCNNQLMYGVEVELIDHYTLSSDVTMDDQLTNKFGFYTVSGYNDPSLGRGIDPEVKIYHDCGRADSCYKFSVPDKYISKGKDPMSVYVAPDIELSTADNNC